MIFVRYLSDGWSVYQTVDTNQLYLVRIDRDGRWARMSLQNYDSRRATADSCSKPEAVGVG
jgi:hypothetical protein